MKKRCAYFEIDGIKIGDKYSDLDISFDVPYMGNALVPLASRFSIDNLSQDTMNYIATNTTLFQNRTRHIKFFLGYEDNVKMLFDGEISKAQPSGQPDRSLMIEAWTSTQTMGTNCQIKYDSVTYRYLIEDAAKKCHYTCSFAPNVYNAPRLQQIVPHFSHTGSEYEYLRRVMSDVTGFNTVKDTILFCLNNGVLNISLADSVNNGVPVRDINASTGLVGIPEPNAAGVDLRVLLDVTLSAGQTIRLTSKVAPLYNGLYNIYGVTHHGSIRSNEFYTDLICQRVYKQGEYGVSL